MTKIIKNITNTNSDIKQKNENIEPSKLCLCSYALSDKNSKTILST